MYFSNSPDSPAQCSAGALRTGVRGAAPQPSVVNRRHQPRFRSNVVRTPFFHAFLSFMSRRSSASGSSDSRNQLLSTVTVWPDGGSGASIQ